MVTSATFETLVTPHLTDLRRFALHLERDPVRGDDLLQHALEREVAQFEDASSDDDITEKLRGLGYIS